MYRLVEERIIPAFTPQLQRVTVQIWAENLGLTLTLTLTLTLNLMYIIIVLAVLTRHEVE